MAHDFSSDVAAGVEQLARWAASVQASAVPSAVLRRAALVTCDDIAAMVTSSQEPEVTGARQQLLGFSARPEATVFDGTGTRADRFTAATANAIAANWAELDEGYRLATCHAGLYTVPAAIAEGEAAERSVAEVLAAVAVGYEIATRFARCWRFPPATLHPHAVFAPVGAAAAVAKLRGAPPGLFGDAISSATTLSMAGPFNHAIKGVLVRNLWAGVGAWAGMHSVGWAASGIGGALRAPHDVYGVALGGEAAPVALTDGLGATWAISDGYHKLFACCQYSHSAVEAALTLLARHGRPLRSAEVEEVRVETHPLGLSLDNPAPATTLAAKFSMQHVVATTLVHGSAGSASFTAATLHRPDVVEMRERVHVAPFRPELPPPHDRPARVTIKLVDGTTDVAECLSAQGGPDRPFPEQVVIDKIAGLVGQVYPRFRPTMASLLDGDARLTDGSWRRFVELITTREEPVATAPTMVATGASAGMGE